MARVISPTFLALLVVAALPTAACERELAEQPLRSAVTGSLPEHGGATNFTSLWRLAACRPNGATCTADTDCCSGACKPIAEGRACVPK